MKTEELKNEFRKTSVNLKSKSIIILGNPLPAYWRLTQSQ